MSGCPDGPGSTPLAASGSRVMLVERGDVIAATDGRATPHAVRMPENPLALPPQAAAQAIAEHARRCGTVIAWSGTLADKLFGDEPHTWLRRGHDAFAALCAAVGPELARLGTRVLFQPHARHVLSDVASTLGALRSLSAEPVGLALAPSALFTDSMLDGIDDHLTRILEGLGPAADMLIIDDVTRGAAPSPDDPDAIDDDALPLACPVGTGLLPRALLLELIERHVPPQVPVVVGPASAQDLPTALEWLAG